MYYYRQPRYFSEFKCIGGGCSDSCCSRLWSVDWKEEEIDKVKNAPNWSRELKELCENSFKYNEERKVYVVILGEENRCPFLTEDNFCKIQRELGEEYLSYTCTVYPRQYNMTNSATYRYCHMSCPEIIKKILHDEKCMDMINAEMKTAPDVIVNKIDTPKNIAKHPELKYAAEIKEFFYEIISNKKLPLESCIILGALAAQSLTKMIGAGDYDNIPEAIKILRAQMHNAAQLKSIENIKPNYNVKLGIVDKLLREHFSTAAMASLLDGEGTLNIDIYRCAELLLEKEFESRQFAWRNIALNLLLELDMLFKPQDNTFLENYSIFVISYAFLRHCALTVVEYNDRLSGTETTAAFGDSGLKMHIKKRINTEKFILRFSAVLSRKFGHDKDFLKQLLQQMQDYKLTSPAYLALLVK